MGIFLGIVGIELGKIVILLGNIGIYQEFSIQKWEFCSIMAQLLEDRSQLFTTYELAPWPP